MFIYLDNVCNIVSKYLYFIVCDFGDVGDNGDCGGDNDDEYDDYKGYNADYDGNDYDNDDDA